METIHSQSRRHVYSSSSSLEQDSSRNFVNSACKEDTPFTEEEEFDWTGWIAQGVSRYTRRFTRLDESRVLNEFEEDAVEIRTFKSRFQNTFRLRLQKNVNLFGKRVLLFELTTRHLSRALFSPTADCKF